MYSRDNSSNGKELGVVVGEAHLVYSSKLGG